MKLTGSQKVLRNAKATLNCGDAAKKHGFKKGLLINNGTNKPAHVLIYLIGNL